MPPPSRRRLNDTCLYWEFVRVVDGEVQVLQPVELRCRWETSRFETPRQDAQGLVVSFDAQVFLAQEVVENSLMALTDLEEWIGTGTGTAGTEEALEGVLHQVKRYDEVTDVKGRTAERAARLMRYKDQMPTVI